jgi:hypothetical protein
VTNQDTLAPRGTKAHNFQMDLSDKRTSGIKHLKAAQVSFTLNFLRYTVCAENHNRLTSDTVNHGNVIELFNKNGSTLSQGINYKFVVDNFVTHVNRCAINIKSTVDDVDSAINPCAKTAWISQLDFGAWYCLELELLHCTHTLPLNADRLHTGGNH